MVSQVVMAHCALLCKPSASRVVTENGPPSLLIAKWAPGN